MKFAVCTKATSSKNVIHTNTVQIFGVPEFHYVEVEILNNRHRHLLYCFQNTNWSSLTFTQLAENIVLIYKF